MFGILTIWILTVIVSHVENGCKANPLSGEISRTSVGEFPFIVSIAGAYYIETKEPWGHVCGGALLTRKHILTAAHCFDADESPNEFFVYVGSGDLQTSAPYDIKQWIKFDDWGKTQRNGGSAFSFRDRDIAIVELAKAVSQNIPLPKISTSCPTKFEGQTVVTAGWGVYPHDPDRPASKLLAKANLQVLGYRACQGALQNIFFLEMNMICTNGTILPAILDPGDSGSPLLRWTENGYEIIGVNIISRPAHKDMAGIFVEKNIHISVFYYKEFISKVAGVRFPR